MKISKILNGLLALTIIGGVLLLSDLENRQHKSKSNDTNGKSGLQAVKGRTYKIGLTYFGPDATFDATMKGLFDGMKALGYVKDSNLVVIANHANGEMSNLQPIHQNMDNQDVDLIVVTSTPSITAAIATVKKHPIVFTMTYTPLEAGAGKSYTDHLPNITGVGSFPPIEGTFNFIKEVLPSTKRVGTIYNSSEANSVKVIEVARECAKKKGIELIETTIINSSEVFHAMSVLSSRNLDAVWVTGDNTAIQGIHGIIKVCNDNKLPLILNDVDYVKEGALAAVGVGWYSTGYYSAPFVARVLNGESPAAIPIENFVEEDITVNQEVAKKLNITFPEKYLKSKKSNSNQKKYKFCLTHFNDSPNSEDVEKGLRAELKNNGLIEGKDFTMKVFNSQGDISTLNSITETIKADKWDIVFVTSTPVLQSFSKKINNSPIVFSSVGDPVRAGVGKSFNDHMYNITGISTLSDFKGLINLVIETMPGIKTVGTIYTPGEINAVIYTEELKKAAQNRGLKLIAVPANTVSEVADAALSITGRGIQAFTQISDNLTGSCSASIIKAAYKSKIPYFGFISDQTKQGAVACLCRDYYYAGVDAAKMAIEILNGKSPKDIPFRYVTKTSVFANQKAMKYFNVKVPDKYLKIN